MTEPKLPKEWFEENRSATAPAPDRRDCPGADALAALAVDPRSAPPGLLDHVSGCSACSDELRRVADDGTLAAFSEALGAACGGSREQPTPAARSADGGRRTMLGGLALAASLVLAVAVTIWLRPVDDTPTLRGGPSVEGLVPPSGAHLEAAPRRFDWPAGGGPEQLVLMNSHAEVLWTAPVARDGGVALPASIGEALVDGRYYWQVRDLESNALLGPFEFRLDRT